jgi:Flp pilus assembly protein protease CpaA
MDFLFIIRVAVALVGFGWAARQDWKTGLIDDYVPVCLFAVGLLASFLSSGLWFVSQSAWTAAIVFILGYVLSRFGLIGEGDILLFASLPIILPYYSANYQIPFFVLVLGVSLFFNLLGAAFRLGSRKRAGEVRFAPYIFAALAFCAILWVVLRL